MRKHRSLLKLAGAMLVAGLSVSACGGGDSSSGQAKDTSSYVSVPQEEAARFLTQATFGPTSGDIESVAQTGYSVWIDSQFELPVTSHLQKMKNETPGAEARDARVDVWWDVAVHARDQLRQRIAFALSEIMVVSDKPDALYNRGYLTGGYYEVLVQNSLGNFRTLLEQVTLNPAMGLYLSMLNNDKPDPDTGRRADENFAREIMQLFSIGLVELNPDGTPRLENGEQVPSYTQSDIENLARVFTGWSFDNGNFNDIWEEDTNILTRPMVPYEKHHDTGEKTVLGTTFPAGQSARQDLAMAMDMLANHPNVGPFISKQLIQRLVTSNPSPEYVARVANVFNSNANGERGDMKAVVRAILVDEEARQGHVTFPETFGKLREPLLRISHLWRAFNAQGGAAPDHTEESYQGFHFHGSDYYFVQEAPLRAPSVFNYYLPSFSPPGVLKGAGLVGPEFQIDTESRIQFMYNAFLGFVLEDGIEGVATAKLQLNRERGLVDTPEQLVGHLDLLMMAGNMSDELRQTLSDYVYKNKSVLKDDEIVRQVLALIFTSAEYAVQR